MPDTRYLKRRVGKRRSGERWYVRVPIPRDLRGRFGRLEAIERGLNTGDLREAQRRRHAVVAEILEMFERARAEPTLDAVLATIRREEVARAHAEWTELLASRGLADASELFNMLIENDDEDAWRKRAQRIVMRHGAAEGSVGPSPTTCSRAACSERLAEVLFDAHVNGAEMALDGRALPATTPRGPSIAEAAERYFDDATRDPAARWTRQTEMQYRASARLFGDFARGKSLGAIAREDAAEFLATIGRLHRDYGRSPKAKGLPLSALLERFPGPPFLTNATLNRHARALHGLYKWAGAVGLCNGHNPFAGQSRPVGRQSRRGWLPFTVEELNALGLAFEVRPRQHSTRGALPWISLVALFSGMREGEICELAVTDVRQEAGVWFFDVTAAKSEAGVRRVPVHSELIRAGFLDYLEHIRAAGHMQLWPGIKPGGPDAKRNWYFTKAFTAYRRSRGVTRERVTFHSFRKCFVRALELAGVDRDRAALVVGHERGFTFRVYNPEGLDVTMLREVVELVRYPGLALG